MYVAILLLNLYLTIGRSDNVLNTPQRHQQRTRQALHDVVQNVDQSPWRCHPPSRPETPTPQPGYIKRTRANCRSDNQAARNSKLLSSLRRRLPHRQDENEPVGGSTPCSGLRINRQLSTVCFSNSLLPLSTSFLFKL